MYVNVPEKKSKNNAENSGRLYVQLQSSRALRYECVAQRTTHMTKHAGRWLAAVSGAGADGAGARQVRAAAPDEARRTAAEHEEALKHRHHQQQQQDDVRNSASAAGRYDVGTRARSHTHKQCL